MIAFKIFTVLALIVISQQASLNPIQTDAKNCGANQVYNQCASACQSHCPKYNSQGELYEISPFCNAMCVPSCVCAQNYVQDPLQNNLCVLRSECTPPLPFSS